jgi:hypothetical protein
MEVHQLINVTSIAITLVDMLNDPIFTKPLTTNSLLSLPCFPSCPAKRRSRDIGRATNFVNSLKLRREDTIGLVASSLL